MTWHSGIALPSLLAHGSSTVGEPAELLVGGFAISLPGKIQRGRCRWSLIYRATWIPRPGCVICDTPTPARTHAHDLRISRMSFRTSCISSRPDPLGVVFRAPADPRFTGSHQVHGAR
ncbi:hypothetical protein C6W93_03030 [Mycobacterium kansasii]|nr:hypothetical protein [Mycobacterium kansasii]